MGGWSRLRSARVRILGAILSVACVGLIVVGSVTFLVQRERVRHEVDERLRTQAATFAVGADAVGPSGPETVLEYLQAAIADPSLGRGEAAFAIIDGRAVFPETAPAVALADDDRFVGTVLEATQGAEDLLLETATTDAGSIRFIAVPVQLADEATDAFYVYTIDLDQELSTIESAILTYVIAALCTLIAIAGVSWFVVGRLLAPIRQLRDTANAITLTDLTARIPSGGNDDIADVTRAMNSMLDRLESSVDVQRQLLDDVRHELKTPITIVRGHLEMMDPADPLDVTSSREIGMAELDRMTRLVDDIDMLATVEGDQFAPVPIDVATTTTRVGELVAVIPGHEWSIEAIGHGVVEADSDRLVQAWLQLADNAAKYTPEGSPIAIGSSIDDVAALFWVRDHGPGIPPAARHRIFRRFDRAHGRRTVGGSGLGLAIVDAIAKAHGGHCSVSDTPGGGATFTIHLPVRQGAPAAELPAPVRAGDVVMQWEATG